MSWGSWPCGERYIVVRISCRCLVDLPARQPKDDCVPPLNGLLQTSWYLIGLMFEILYLVSWVRVVSKAVWEIASALNSCFLCWTTTNPDDTTSLSPQEKEIKVWERELSLKVKQVGRKRRESVIHIQAYRMGTISQSNVLSCRE